MAMPGAFVLTVCNHIMQKACDFFNAEIHGRIIIYHIRRICNASLNLLSKLLLFLIRPA